VALISRAASNESGAGEELQGCQQMGAQLLGFERHVQEFEFSKRNIAGL